VSESARYSRQQRLLEVGERGQARLAAAVVRVEGREAPATEALYLERAGVSAVQLEPDRTPRPFVHAAHFRNVVAEREAAAAWRALKKTLEVLREERG
jgi:hypothetical protein